MTPRRSCSRSHTTRRGLAILSGDITRWKASTWSQRPGFETERLQDAVDVLDERDMIKRHKFIGDAIGNIRLNARGRQEAERIESTQRAENARDVVEKKTPDNRVDKALAYRRELLEDLYRMDEESPGASGGWNAGDPHCMPRAREAEYLRVKGFVTGSIGPDGGVSVRLTPSGRDYVEGGGFWSKQDALAAATMVPTAASQPKLPRLDVTYGEKLGSGAFGTVWQARDQLLDREIAVKFLTSTDQALDEDALLREARSLAKLAHQNLVRVYGAAWLRHPMTGLVAPAILAGC